MTSMSVVFPAPEDPMSAVIVPGRANPDTPLSRSISSSFLPPGMGTEYQRFSKANAMGREMPRPEGLTGTLMVGTPPMTSSTSWISMTFSWS
ncbi:hypothetical protein PF010_g27434 [Phytophthora fragariae]|uniref:Uncharacterized protein n=1 Tax=Phytophthora fragariae TaxID=53985 RepID=A0A6A3Q2S2_9STRA|nr:hypothetical protein PF010_g27434 [Phytophthora fragariae]KAE9067889.1 hypothetical protein PF007_g27902 [Phytophthora fragariae]KAE9079755.1 hypothetical protein PF006_g27455 [Phytophthora fragariae]